MLKDYSKIDPIIYAEMNSIVNNKISHAYIFNLNDNVYAEDMIMAFVKEIICSGYEAEKINSICKRIDDGNYLELKKVYPDGLWIKKEQLDELQREFSTKSLESDKRIYIIYEAEKLNKSAANSLLKFLEEPQEGVIAILLTNNINLMLDTISSRCQTITFSKNKVEDFINHYKIEENITMYKLLFSVFKIGNLIDIDEEKKVFFDNIISFIKNYETKGIKTIFYVKQYFLSYFNDKDLIINFFKCLILFYRDVLGEKINKKILYFDDYKELVEKVAKKNSSNKIIKKLNILINSENLVRKNLNINLLIDSMIIDMEEIYG